MRLFFDQDAQRFIVGAGTTQELAEIIQKRSPSAPFEVQFLRGIVPQELASDASGIIEVKIKGEYDSQPLTAALAWVKTGTGEDAIYTFTLGTITDPLNALLGIEPAKAFTVVAATDLFTSTAHGRAIGDRIQVYSDDTLPAGLLANTNYFIIATGFGANTFKVSLTLGGSSVDVTDTGTGNQFFTYAADDIVSVTLMFEMQYIENGQKTKSQTLDFVLVNDVVRDGDVPPAMPALAYDIVLPEISDLAGFKAIPTVGLTLGYLVAITIDVSGTRSRLFYELTSGPAVDPEPADVEPNDYDLSTNDKHWKGAVGPSGGAGVNAGIPFKWNTATSGNPGSGKILGNNATLASITAINISETDQDSNALAALFATFDDSTSTIRGRLLVHDPATPANFAIFAITGSITDAGAYDTFSATLVTSGGTLTNNLPVQLFFTWNGDKGDTGDGGFKYLFNSATSGDPATGKLLFDNATFASATSINISETDANANALASLLAAIDNSTSTNKCLVLAQKAGGTAILTFFITSVLTDNGTYDTFSITPIGSTGTIANGDALFLNFFPIGDKGTTGNTGSTGPEAAYHYLWNAGTSGDPGSGKLLINNGTYASATALNISETDNDTNGISAVLATWDDSTSTIKGLLFIHSATTPTKFALFHIAGTITDNGSYDTFVIAHVAHGTSFANNDPVSVVFIRTGDKGTDGGTTYDAAVAIGAGTSGVDIDLTAASMTTARVLTGNTDFDLINPVNGKVTIVHIKQAAASSYTVTFNGTIIWVGTSGSQPPQSTGFNVIDAWTFWYDGTNLYGTWAPGG